MGETTASRQPKDLAFDISINVPPQTSSECFDDDGRLKRTGTVWTASAHIITAVIGSGVLSLAWSMAQLGWIAGPTVMLLFSVVTYYTSTLLATCYRSGDPDSGKRNYTYMDAVRANLGGLQVKLCGAFQYMNIFGVSIGYTIASSISLTAIERSICFHSKGDDSPCRVSSNPYMIGFGVVQIILSQIPDFHQIWWLSIVAAIMSFTYSIIGLGLGIAEVAENGLIKGSFTGITIDTVTETEKIWRSFQALGAIAFAYSYSVILIEIQDTVKSPPAEHKTMRKATMVSISVTTVFYMLCGCFGYAAFGDSTPGNLLTGFGFYKPFWLIGLANAAIVAHLVGAYQVFCQPLFAFVEKHAFPNIDFANNGVSIPVPGLSRPCRLNPVRLAWRTAFVVAITLISMLVPLFNEVMGFLGAMGFWPLTVYFPVEMYIAAKRIPRWSTRWISLEILSVTCLMVSIVSLAGSMAGVASHLKKFKPFQTIY